MPLLFLHGCPFSFVYWCFGMHWLQLCLSSGTVDYTLFVAALIPVDVCPVLEAIGVSL